MKLSRVLWSISPIDRVRIQDSKGIIYAGVLSDFNANVEGFWKLLERKVDRISANKDVIIVLLTNEGV